MKILIVCRSKKGRIAPFIQEQAESLVQKGIDIQYFFIEGENGLIYIKLIKKYKETLHQIKPEIIHAHYGISGLFANIQRKIPVITTYHGSDVNNFFILQLSRIAVCLSKHNIFVSEKNAKLFKNNNKSVIPCGVNIDLFTPMDKSIARKALQFNENKKYILFSSSFSNKVKNYPLAKAAVDLLENTELIEFKGYSREESAILFNAADMALLTSFTEGSPQFIKEAMACNTPIVSVNVGDVNFLLSKVDGCSISEYNNFNLKNSIEKILNYSHEYQKTNGRNKIESLKLDLQSIAEKIIALYQTAKLPNYLWDIHNTNGYKNRMGVYKTHIELSFITKHIPKNSQTLLDIAGGSGRFAIPLGSFFNQITVLDINENALSILKERKENIQTICSNYLTADIKTTYDMAICIEALGYFNDIDGFLKKTSSILNKEGVFILTAVNPKSWRFIIRNLSFRKTHYTNPTINELKLIANKEGLEIIDSKGFYWTPLAVNSNSVWVSFFAWLERIVLLNSMLSQSPWFIIAMKKTT